MKNLFLAFLLLTSGFCGISYEILYGRILGDLMGDQFIVSASILLTFLLGIGFGTFYAHRLWSYLWLIEGGIGIYGTIIALSSGLLDKVLYAHFSFLQTGIAGSLVICVVLLLFPAFLIGTSLPIFAGYLSRISSGLVFGKAYAVYNFGAGITVLLIEFWLIRALGIRAATLTIAGLNGFVSLSLFFFFGSLRREKPVEEREGAVLFPRSHLTALALASIGSAVFQLLMVKLAEFILGPFRETFALVLCLVLLGIALGSALTKWFRLSFRLLLFANLAGLIWMLAGLGITAEWYAASYPGAVDGYFSSVALKLELLAMMMGLPALTFGATIPALITAQKNAAKESGQLLFVSSLANAAGFLLMAFYLHTHFDYGTVIIVIAGFSAAALLLFVYRSVYEVILVAVLLAGVLFAHRRVWDENLLYLGHTAFHSSEDLKEEKEEFSFPEKFKGHQDVFSITWANGSPHFFINGYISIALDTPWERYVGAFSSTFAPRSDKALVLGLGSGATASVVGLLFDQTDAVEINAMVLKNLFRMKAFNFDIEHNPRVNIIHDDAVHFTKAYEGKYSLIINTVTTPLYFSSAKLYTRDFMEAIKKRLKPDGVYVTWIDSRIGNRGVDIILNTLGQSFAHCGIAYVRSSYFLLLCSREPIRAHQPRIAADNPIVGPFFMSEFGIKPDWLSYGLLNPDAVSLVKDPDTPLNTLNYPALEFEMTRLRRRGFRDFQVRLMESMRLEAIKEALAPDIPWNPVDLALQTEIILKDNRYTRRWRRLVRAEVDDFEEQYDDARIKYFDSFAAGEKSADRYHKFGYVLMRKEHYRKAIAVFEKALALNPKRNNTYFNIGACYEYLKEYPSALENYRAEGAMDPDDEDVPYRVGRVLEKMGRYGDALEVLNEAVRVNPEAAAYYYRGKAYEGLGQTSEAGQSYRAALKEDPNYGRARKALRDLLSEGGN